MENIADETQWRHEIHVILVPKLTLKVLKHYANCLGAWERGACPAARLRFRCEELEHERCLMDS